MIHRQNARQGVDTARHGTEREEAPIRVTVVQSSLAKYRVPVFRELAHRPGIDLRVVYGTASNIPNVEAEGFTAIATPRWEGRVSGTLLSLHGSEWEYCTRRHSDVVVLRWSPRSVTLLPALIRARMAGVPTVLWGHGFSKNPRGKRRAVRAWIARRATAVVFYEPLTRDEFVREGWNPERLFVALNSLDPTEIEAARQQWQSQPDQLTAFRREHGLEQGPSILFVSRLLPANRADLLIRATAELTQAFPHLKTVIIGNGPAERERLESLAAELGVTASVVFQDGIYDENMLAPWFLSADVVCYPANMGLSLIHAFWYGVPVVTHTKLDIQGPEVFAFEHGVNGLSYELDNLASLVDSLRQLLGDEPLRKTMSQAARRTVEGRFTIPRMVDGLEAAIRYAYNSAATARN